MPDREYSQIGYDIGSTDSETVWALTGFSPDENKSTITHAFREVATAGPIHLRASQPMFTFKPANDTEEFYAVIDRIEIRQLLKKIAYTEEEIRSLRNLPLPTTPSSSEEDTSHVPFPPHAGYAP
jgi:hypothetical protein